LQALKRVRSACGRYYTMRSAKSPDAALHFGDARFSMPNFRNALLIYNPTSGRRRRTRLAEVENARKLLAADGLSVELAATSARDSATQFAMQAAAEKRDLVIVCGGDGTINEVVNGLAGSSVAMGILPAGTANILAKELGVPWDIAAAARKIARSEARRIALGAVLNVVAGGTVDTRHGAADAGQGARYFLCLGGAGADAAVVHAVRARLKDRAGIFAYWAAGTQQLFQYQFPRIRVSSDEMEVDATLVIVGRTAHYGGPFKITSGASLFEDSFEVVTYASASSLRYLGALPSLWAGRLRKVKGIAAWKTRELTCTSLTGAAVQAQVDGEPVGMLPLHFRIVPDALTLLVPRDLRG
jgi:diacylglycerol kinase (ATP)